MTFNISNIKANFDKLLYTRVRDLMKYAIKYNMNRSLYPYRNITFETYKYYDY